MALFAAYNDEQLLSLLTAGDEDAFTEIYNRYWNKLYFLAHKHLKSAEASEEIVQDVFLALWRKKTELSIQSLPLYLAAMARYAVYRFLAKEKKRIKPLAGETNLEAVADTFEIDNKLLLEIIEKLSNVLPEKCRLVFVHNKLLDQPLHSVAEQLNISPKTAEAHLTKALKVIRRKLSNVHLFLFF